jgi:hypothetical protein
MSGNFCHIQLPGCCCREMFTMTNALEKTKCKNFIMVDLKSFIYLVELRL